MHEMGIAENILDICIKEAKQVKASRINEINLLVGKIAGIEVDSLTFCFDVIKKDTVAGNAAINIKENKVEIVCRECKSHYCIDEFPWICDKCGSWKYDIIHGDEFQIINIDVD